MSSFTVRPMKPLLGAFCFVRKFPEDPVANEAKLVPVDSEAKLIPVSILRKSGCSLDLSSFVVDSNLSLRKATEPKETGELVLLKLKTPVLAADPNTDVETLLAGVVVSTFTEAVVVGVPPKIFGLAVVWPKPDSNSFTPSADLFRFEEAEPNTEGCSTGDLDLSVVVCWGGMSAVFGVVLSEDENIDPVAGDPEPMAEPKPMVRRDVGK